MKPFFPEGFTVYNGGISISHPSAVEASIFTITVSTSEQSVSAELPIEIIGCDGIFTQLLLNKCTLTLSYENNTITITSMDRDYICLPEVEFEYTLSCTQWEEYILGRSEYGDFSFILDGKKESGVIDLSGKKPPLIEFPSIFVSSHFIEAYVFSYGRILNSTIEPELPGSVEIYRHHLNGCVNDPVKQNFTLIVHHPSGVVTHPFSIYILTCPKDHMLRFQSLNPIRVTDEKSTLIAWIPNNRNDMVCVPNPLNLVIESNSTVTVLDEQGPLGMITPEWEKKAFRYTFRIPYLSTYRYKKGDVETTWMEKQYDDSLWETGSGPNWGNFTNQSHIYFRHPFSLSGISRYTNGVISISALGYCRIFVNGLLVGSYGQKSPSFVIPLSLLSEGSNLLAIELLQTFSESILFDLQLLLLTSHYRELTLLGEAREEQAVPDGRPEYAFKDDEHYKWRVHSYPASIMWRYFNHSQVIVNQIQGFYYGTQPITEFVIEGMYQNQTTVLYTNQGDLLKKQGEFTIDFENVVPYDTYKLVFKQGDEESFAVNKLMLRYVNRFPCNAKNNVPTSNEGTVLYLDCPRHKAGFRTMSCINEDYHGVWIESTAMCVDKTPTGNNRYIDFILRLQEVTPLSWKRMSFNMTMLYLISFPVFPSDINHVGTRVVNETALDVYTRFSVKNYNVKEVREVMDIQLRDVNLFLARMWENITGEVILIKTYSPNIGLYTIIVLFCILTCILCIVYKVLSNQRKKNRLLSETVYSF